MHTPDSSLDTCINTAYRYIFKRPKTVHEVTIHLRSKGYDDDTISTTLQHLHRKKYVDDNMFVDMFLESELIKKGRPAVIVMQKLLQRGIDKHLIKEHMTQHEQDIQQGLHQRINKEITRYKAKGIDGFDIIQKLMKKGFRLHDIKAVIRQRQGDESS